MLSVKNNIFYLGSKHPDRKFFDQLIPLPQGTSYNSFLVKGSEKTALVDTVYPEKIWELVEKLNNNSIETLDYIICNHGEQDHSGALPVLIDKYPDVKIVTNEKCKELIMSMLHIVEDKFMVINDGDELSLGDKTLKFILAPWVHWPDTMFTFIKEDNVLFTCDFLGAHYTHYNLFADYSDELVQSAKRYYAEIMMPFRTFAKKYTAQIKEMNPEIVLPSHGPIYQNPKFILDLYEEWTSDTIKNKVLIPYVSMYESTKILVDTLAKKLKDSGVEAVPFDLIEGDEGELSIELIDTATVIFGAPMVLSGPHPAAVEAAYFINMLRPKIKFYSIIGSFGWGGNLTGVIENMLTVTKPEKIDYVIVKGKPKGEDFVRIDELALKIIEKHNSL